MKDEYQIGPHRQPNAAISKFNAERHDGRHNSDDDAKGVPAVKFFER